MVNQKLAEWIKSQEIKGYSDEKLKEILLKNGYKNEDIDEALNFLKNPSNPKNNAEVQNKSSSIKQAFKPTILKCILPVLVFALIIISFVVNSIHAPALGEYLCNSIKTTEDLYNASQNIRDQILINNINSQNIVDLIKQQEDITNNYVALTKDYATHAQTVIEGNAYLEVSGIYTLDPYFPVSCESLILQSDQINMPACRYYISKESYTCIKNSITNIQQNAENTGFALLSISNLPSYSNISLIAIILHGLLLAIITYIIISVITLARLKLSEQNKKVTLIITIFIVLIYATLAWWMSTYTTTDTTYIILIIPLILIFIISSNIKNDHTNKVFLYAMIGLLITLLVGGIFVINYWIAKSTTVSTSASNNIDYKIIPCDNRTILSMQEKLVRQIPEKYINEEWNICNSPSCTDICKKECIANIGVMRSEISLRGNNPSCICGCQKNINQ